MFWRVSGFTQPSVVEGLLERPYCKLEDLLLEEQLLQVPPRQSKPMLYVDLLLALFHKQ